MSYLISFPGANHAVANSIENAKSTARQILNSEHLVWKRYVENEWLAYYSFPDALRDIHGMRAVATITLN